MTGRFSPPCSITHPARGVDQTQGEILQPAAAGPCRTCASRARARAASCVSFPPIPEHPLIEEYLEAAGHGPNPDTPLFQPIKNNVHGHTLTALTPDSIYFEGVLKYLSKLGILGENMGHMMRHGRNQCPG